MQGHFKQREAESTNTPEQVLTRIQADGKRKQRRFSSKDASQRRNSTSPSAQDPNQNDVEDVNKSTPAVQMMQFNDNSIQAMPLHSNVTNNGEQAQGSNNSDQQQYKILEMPSQRRPSQSQTEQHVCIL